MSLWNVAEERLDPEERIQLQLERFQSTLNRAYKNVPFYRNRFQECSIDPSHIETLTDLRKIPFTEREHLSENYPYGLFAVPLRDVVRIHTTQGSAVNPTVSGFTKHDVGVWRELVARALFASGVTSSDILQIELDPGLTNWGRAYKDGAEAIESSVIPLTALSLEKQLMILRDYKTSVLVTTPSAANQMIHLLFQHNLNPNALALKTVILVGEAPEPKTRIRIEEQLHVNTWLNYGLSEVPGPALAFECEHRCGLHISEDHFLPEVIDPITGETVAVGESGELVLTTLTTRAFPLIRFRTGDRVRLLPEACPCGRTLIRMVWDPCRTDEMRVIRGVKLHHGQILFLMERILGFQPQYYRFFIQSEEYRDYLEVWLQVDQKIFSDEIKEMEKLCQRASHQLSQELGVPVKIRLKEQSSFMSLPPSQGIEDLRKSIS